MASSRLNLGGLRRRYISESMPKGVPAEQQPSPISRREFLSGSGLVVTSASPLIRSLQNGFSSVEVVGHGSKAFVRTDGITRWTIDAERFSGNPRLTIRRGRQTVIELANARFPGTGLPADFVCQISRGFFGWRAKLNFSGFQALFSLDLESWLVGQSEAVATLSEPLGTVLRLPGNNSLHIQRCAAKFFPDWRFEFRGPSTARAFLDGQECAADAVQMELLSSSPASLLSRPAQRRTLWSLSRGANKWGIMPRLPQPAGWSLLPNGDVFSRVELEVAETQLGEIRSAFLAQSTPGQIAFRLRPSAESASLPLAELPLQNALYAVSHHEDAESVLMAGIDPETTWVNFDGFHLGVSSHDQRPIFEQTSRKPDKAKISPQVCGIAIPDLPRDFVNSFPVPAGARVPWLTNLVCGVKHFLHVDGEKGTACLAPGSIRWGVLRPEDLLFLDFEFRNAAISSIHGKPFLTAPANQKDEPLMIVTFPAQHIVEETFVIGAGSDQPLKIPPPQPTPVRTRMAGKSRLVFRLRAQSETEVKIPFHVKSFLNWSGFSLNTAANAVPPTKDSNSVEQDDLCPTVDRAPSGPMAPGDDQTAIELPYRVLLSPSAIATWRHSYEPKNDKSSGRVELWHTRLESAASDPSIPTSTDPKARKRRLETVRAIWTPDLADPAHQDPFCAPMNPNDRRDIVRLSSDPAVGSCVKGFSPCAIPVEHLMLSALGGWFNCKAHWEPPGDIDTEGWEHRAIGARDVFVQVAKKGFLMPFGHRAALIKVSERQVLLDQSQNPITYILMHFIILVKQKEKLFASGGAYGNPYDGRQLPYKKVTIITPNTPYLDPASFPELVCTSNKQDISDGLWPKVLGQDFRFACSAVDIKGSIINFTLPMKFQPNSTMFARAGNQPCVVNPNAKTFRDKYNNDPISLRTADFAGQHVAYAPSDREGVTDFVTQQQVFQVLGPDPSCQTSDPATACHLEELPLRDQPPFYPSLGSADVFIPALQHVAPVAKASTVSFSQAYLDHAFPGMSAAFTGGSEASDLTNKGEVFLDISPTPLSFPGQQSGGVGQPSLSIVALSRSVGLVGGPGGTKDEIARRAVASSVQDFVNGVFQPLNFFEELASAKLLGVIPLRDVVPYIGDISDKLEKIPQLVYRQIAAINATADEIRSAANQFVATLDSVFSLVKTQVEAVESSSQSQVSSILGIEKGIWQALQGNYPSFNATFAPLGTPRNTVACQNLVDARDALLTHLQQIGATQPAYDRVQQTFGTMFQSISAAVARVRVRVAALRDAVTSLPLGNPSQIGSALRDLFQRYPNDSDAILLVAALPAAADQTRGEIEAFISSNLDGTRLVQKNVDLVNGAFSELKSAIKRAVDKAPPDLVAAADSIPAQITKGVTQLKADLSAIPQEIETCLTSTLQDFFISELNSLSDQIGQIVNTVLNTIINNAIKAIAPVIDSAIKQALDTWLNILSLLNIPTEITVSFDWQTELHDGPQSFPVFIGQLEGNASRLEMHARLTQRLSGAPESSVSASISDCQIQLVPSAPFLRVGIRSVSFNARNGQSPDFHVTMADPPVQLTGPLDFVSDLQKKLKFLSGDNGPVVTVTQRGVLAGYAFPIPAMTLGAFNVAGIKLAAGVELSFAGEPARVRFSFSERHNPFVITVGIFGGGGFFAAEATPSRMELLEGALDFGASAELTVAVAHGRAQIFGGFYFGVEPTRAVFTGYFSAYGVLDVAGLISMSVLFYLGLSYVNDSGTAKAVGECTVSVEIDILFFSAHYDLTVRREFSKGSVGNAMLRAAREPAQHCPPEHPKCDGSWQKAWQDEQSYYAWSETANA
jgi:hypothetical protein